MTLTRRSFVKCFVYASISLGAGFPGKLFGKDRSRRGPQPGRYPLDANGQMQISPDDRCPVCAMTVIKYPKTSCAIELVDGTTFYFCGTKCLIKSWLQPEIFLAAQKADLNKAVVREYFSGEQVNALSVLWVAGSDVVGPMGPAVVPLLGESHINAFNRRHGGKIRFRLADMTTEKWKQMMKK